MGESMDVIVVAAGRSTRMRGIDKVFVPVNRVPMIAYCLAVFEASPVVERIALVIADPNLAQARSLVTDMGYKMVHAVVAGGDRRQDSVRRGLDALPGGKWIAVHDGARPFIDNALLERGLDAAQATGAAIAAIAVKDTIKSVGKDRLITGTPPRESLWAAQTPQIFRRSLLDRAHKEVPADVTDDAAMVEMIGGKVTVFEGSPLNIKVTTPEDLVIAEAVARLCVPPYPGVLPQLGRDPGPHGERESDRALSQSKGLAGSPQLGEGAGGGAPRWGTGFDGHQLVPGGPLLLGGVEIAFDAHLEGHSDGDVLLHAVASSVLGAAGVGDLGRYFPSTDATLKGTDSREILRRAQALAARAGWLVEFVDATIIAQRPKLSPYLEQIGRSIAETLGLQPGAVNVKVTSTDHVGAIGQGEGIAAQAVATVRSVRPSP